MVHPENAPEHGARSSWARRSTALLTFVALTSVVACSDILEVDNPNNIAEAELANSKAAEQQANGVLASLSRMLAAIATPYATTTDELDWIGSRDAWLDLESGAISNVGNEFTDQAFPFVGEARFVADGAIERLEGFKTKRTLKDSTDLVRTYLYSAIIYSAIPDMFDDFAFSNKRTPGPAIGRANMSRLYDTAVVYLDRALALGGDVDLSYAILGVRARVKHARAAWAKVTPKGTTPASPLVNDAGANADATAALALKAADALFEILTVASSQPGINVFFEVNGRNEMKIGAAYEALKDPITGARDPASKALIEEFQDDGEEQGDITIISNRELHLILAEGALAAGNTGTFTTEINAVRKLDKLTPYTGQIPALQLLRFERMANLFLMNRRLIDLYRFGEKVADWKLDPNFESAFNVPGLLFPIPNVERLANPCIAKPAQCGG